MRRIIFAVTGVFFCIWATTQTFGAMIKLKSGEVVNADIIERTADHVKVNTKGLQVTYYSDEIDSISGEDNKNEGSQTGMKVASQRTGPQGILGDKEDLVNLGSASVYLTPPAGWSKQANIQPSKGFIIFRYQQDKENNKVAINVTTSSPSEPITRSILYAHEVKKKTRQNVPNLIVKEPTLFKKRGLDGSFIEMSAKDNNLSIARYYFLIGRTILTLQLIDMQGTYQENLGVLQGLAKSIRVK